MTTLLTPDELAEILRVPRQRVYSLTHRKAIPFKKIGRTIRFDPNEIAEWMEKGGAK